MNHVYCISSKYVKICLQKTQQKSQKSRHAKTVMRKYLFQSNKKGTFACIQVKITIYSGMHAEIPPLPPPPPSALQQEKVNVNIVFIPCNPSKEVMINSGKE